MGRQNDDEDGRETYDGRGDPEMEHVEESIGREVNDDMKSDGENDDNEFQVD